MRDLSLLLALLLMTPVAILYPAAGFVAWVWFSIESPHEMVYSFAAGKPLSSVIAVATLVGWVLHRGDKRWPGDAVPWLVLFLYVWISFNQLFVPFREYSYDYWNLFSRTFIEIFLAFFLLNTKARIQGVVWAMIIGLGFYGVKGGAFTIITAGHSLVWGPPGTQIADNNQLALAVVMVLPLVYYAMRSTVQRWLRVALGIAIVLQVIMVFGTYSRGGVIALGTMMFIVWLRSDRKFLYAILGCALLAVGLSIMPSEFWARLHTLQNVEGDSSFMGRVEAWRVAIDYATDHFPFGAGYYALQLPELFHAYLPQAAPHAAHSIYFQVLGEHGFIGFALYIAALFFGLRNAWIVIRQTRGQPGLEWAHDLADMSRVSLIAYLLGGAALSVAYFDGYLLQFAILSNLRRMTARSRLPAAPLAEEPLPRPRQVAADEPVPAAGMAFDP